MTTIWIAKSKAGLIGHPLLHCPATVCAVAGFWWPSVGFTAPMPCWVRLEGWWVGAADCWIILLRSCVGIMCEPESGNAVFAGWDAAKMSVAVAVGHVSGCERWLTVPRLGRFRLADGHLWRCEKASFATPNTQNYQPNIAPITQPADRQPVTKTR